MKRVILSSISFLLLLFLAVGCASVSRPSDSEVPYSEMPNDDSSLWFHFYTTEFKDWGDCTFVRFPNGETMLIDAGTRKAGAVIVQDLSARGISEIDYLMISHYHSDHVSGLKEIIPQIKFKQAYTNGYYPTDFAWVDELLVNNGTNVSHIHAGDRLTIGDVRIDVLWPLEEYVAELPVNISTVLLERGSVRDLNNHSLVCRMTYGRNSILFTGDLYELGESEVLEYYSGNPEILDCDVIKIMHHGRDTSSSEIFIKAVSPAYGFSMGSFTMMTDHFLRYYKAGCRPYLSWQNGNAYVTMDGETITVNVDDPEINQLYKRYTDALDKLNKEQ